VILLKWAEEMDVKRVRFLGLCMAPTLLACLAGAWAQSNGIDPALLAKAKAGDADAEFRVAVSYANLGNPKESHRWHLLAAQNGNVRAMTIVAADYEFGRNVAQDDRQAFSWSQSR
jgi:TPR repeat protein